MHCLLLVARQSSITSVFVPPKAPLIISYLRAEYFYHLVPILSNLTFDLAQHLIQETSILSGSVGKMRTSLTTVR